MRVCARRCPLRRGSRASLHFSSWRKYREIKKMERNAHFKDFANTLRTYQNLISEEFLNEKGQQAKIYIIFLSIWRKFLLVYKIYRYINLPFNFFIFDLISSTISEKLSAFTFISFYARFTIRSLHFFDRKRVETSQSRRKKKKSRFARRIYWKKRALIRIGNNLPCFNREKRLLST